MSETATIIAVAYGIAVVIGAVVCFAIWRSTLRSDTGAVDEEAYSRREGLWLVVVLTALFALLMGTIFYVPYGETAGANKQVVKVDAVQFAWSITPPAVKRGVPVEFSFRTRDVNHGFGVYTDDGVMQFQVQVIPGATQKKVFTFDEPGTYEVLCLEFCGRDHHKMRATFEVTS